GRCGCRCRSQARRKRHTARYPLRRHPPPPASAGTERRADDRASGEVPHAAPPAARFHRTEPPRRCLPLSLSRQAWTMIFVTDDRAAALRRNRLSRASYHRRANEADTAADADAREKPHAEEQRTQRRWDHPPPAGFVNRR